jgi:hypothetical protein
VIRAKDKPDRDMQGELIEMNPIAKAFKQAARNACKQQRFPFPQFMGDRGLEAILIDADANNYSAKEIAAHVLAECCVADGKFNNFQVGILAVIRFLSHQFGAPHIGDVQAFRDLLTILDGGGSYPAIMRWMDTHYPG